MIALFRWIISLAVLAMWCALIGTGLYVAMYEAPSEAPEAQAIIVLGAGATKEPRLTDQSTERLTHGLSLFEAGAAPLIAFTGGGTIPDATLMARSAMDGGVPENAILTEEAAQSTLQNALFIGDIELLDKSLPILIVTHRYHLPRAWASFRWAGFETVHLSAADPDAGLTLDQNLLWEAVKWPFNILRAAAASAAMAGNVPRENWVMYLK